MTTILVTTVLFGAVLGRYCNVVGLALASAIVIVASLMALPSMWTGMAYWLIAGLNLVCFETTVVASMLYHAKPPRKGVRALLCGWARWRTAE